MASAAPFVLIAAGAALLLLPAAAGANIAPSLGLGGESDAASTGLGDILNGATGDWMDMTNSSAGGWAGDPTANRQAFLDMIAHSEIGSALLAETDNGYNVLVGATPGNPLTFSDYSRHPRILNRALNSTAAGRYQINWPTYQTLSAQTGLSDFSPSTQDAMALQLAANKGALADIDAGNIQTAIAKCARVWASFPSAGYGQHENSLDALLAAYQGAGGTIA
ncbi:phage lysozyme family protein [Burkholderia pseudomallei]|uniref:glycoside hydrolase family 24 protein n=2 Tax=Burkholderia pseudomallei TaxID=28450 RepID=UPI00050ECD24|nr:glycoside hydrolase family 104 protein [Burkholderia pseudomallei]AIV51703.1 lysozyme domain protein [Burkholderia pseudomallei MSHR1153]AIV77352.1 lysozyme domain protein [Burkholderia pseudomallei]KGD46128.1 lysozyme [Burkholderia pseudomallei]KGU77509.1 lysozyme [Burkholderia pseudomallei MSHR543]CAJ2780180.1 phage lysozyme family protein [Burkholderia pseudomallei]